MIYNYGFSIAGKSHLDIGVPCQDSHYIKKMDNGWCIAAVADGVGSAKNSKIGSEIAAKTVVEFCDKYMPWDYSIIGIKSMLRTAYNYAFKKIIIESEKNGEPIESYDTTLSVVIYDGHHIIYGHSGDGAIVVYTTYGDFIEITKPQKGDDGFSVIPLRGGYTQWEIDSYDEEIASVLLMTDGMLNTLCPYLLRDNLNKKSRIYIPLGIFFADRIGFEENNVEKTKKQIYDFLFAQEDYDINGFYSRLSSIYKEYVCDDAENIIGKIKEKNYPWLLMNEEQDDKTMVALINPEVPVDKKEKEYYSEADWEKLRENWYRAAYPHLFKEKDSDGAIIVNSEESVNEKDYDNEDKQNSGFSEELNNNEKTEIIIEEKDDINDEKLNSEKDNQSKSLIKKLGEFLSEVID